jgi:hypothetical protein
MRSLQASRGHDGIGKIEELLEYPTLYSLLMMMDKAIDVQFQRTITSGKSDEGRYIGYDIQGERYCFYIYFYGKECKLIFMTWDCSIDVEKFKGNFGQVVKNAGPMRWQVELNLNGPSVRFFSVSNQQKSKVRL